MLFDSHRDAPGGFGIKLMAAGSRTFFLRYTIDGKQRLKTIGAFPAWRVEAARAEAQRLRVEIDSGRDPLEAKRRRRLEPSVADLAGEWIEKHARRLKSGPEIERAITVNLLPQIGKLKASDVTRTDLIHALEGLFATSPRAGEQTLSYIKQAFRFALDRGYLGSDPAAGLRKSAFGGPKRVATGRERILTAEEIKDFWNATPAGMDALTRLCLKFVLATGQRPGECAGMRLDEINGDRWMIPATRRKTAQAHEITLTSTALALVDEAKREVARRQKRRGGGEAEFVFETGRGRCMSVAALSKAVLRCSADLGVKSPPWTPHDLRRTCRTGLAAIGIAPHIAEAVIGHQRRGVIGIYDRHSYSGDISDALEKWESRLWEIVSDNVVSFQLVENEDAKDI